MPDENKWPDLRGFVDNEHRKGRRVLLWFKMWNNEGLDESECVMDLCRPVAADPTSPRYRDRVKKMMYRLLSDDADCYNCDGFKIDFANCMPLGETVESSGGKYGVELLKQLMFGSKLLYVFLIIPMYFGGGIVPTYILYSQIGLINNYMVYFLPGCFSFYNMIIIRSYMSSLPYSLHEAAKIDGANDLCVFFKIILPLAKPILATIALWTAVGIWSDWTTPLYYITKSKMYNLQYLLVQVLKEAEKVSQLITQAALRGEIIETKNTTITTEGVKCAQMIVSTIPIVIIYPFLQKYFIQGVTLGAVKD